MKKYIRNIFILLVCPVIFMRIPKRYGQSKIPICPFCSKQAIAKNSQGLNVCQHHKEKKLPDIKCACGSYLELKTGKFGPYFNCINCGNINLNKGLEIMEMDIRKKTHGSSIKRDPNDKEDMYPGFDYEIE